MVNTTNSFRFGCGGLVVDHGAAPLDDGGGGKRPKRWAVVRQARVLDYHLNLHCVTIRWSAVAHGTNAGLKWVVLLKRIENVGSGANCFMSTDLEFAVGNPGTLFHVELGRQSAEKLLGCSV